VKKFDIWAAPDVLILHLKRFQFTPGQYFVHREKISDVVKFPVDGFDLSTFVKGPQVYIFTFIYIYVYIYINSVHIWYLYICIFVCIFILHIYIYMYMYIYM
jgi:hypothetical protein